MKKETKEFLKLLKMTQEELASYILTNVANAVYKEGYYIYIENDKHNPILTSHLDTINSHSNNKCDPIPKLAIIDGVIHNQNPNSVLGGDDRAGVWIMLQLLYKGNSSYNYLFCFDEEIGGHGSTKFAKDYKHKIKDSSCYISLDRRGSNEVASYDYDNEELFAVFEDIGYERVNGSFTDCVNLSEETDIACCNLSVGYNNEHRASEIQDIAVMYKVVDVLERVSHNFIKQYKVEFSRYSDEYLFSDDVSTPVLCECCGQHLPLYSVAVDRYDYQLCIDCKAYYV